ncbi:MAG: HPr family phosphocarrier protein [Megasphaera sp.]|jgi:phosphocarrier protein|uniref:HPr family phosphocarrier protein n=1 Tax=Megasphaera sueciensis TaxID=349094 RepID=UPI003CFCD4E9|nr:HPr family phosphocarrier protein [Megasphaera sp.]MCI1824009.1 HPr family phosphocarrier protein [Megasphaera sp.]
MKKFTYTINDPAGIHARPAGILVKEAKKFESSISILTANQKGDLKRIFAVMGLGVKQGQTITIQISGPDEDHAADVIKSCLKSNL